MHRIKFEYRIVALYVIIGVLWIFFSDKLILYFVKDPDLLTNYQIIKGLGYVLLTGLLFYFFLKRHLIKLRKAEAEARESDRLKSAFLQNMSHEIRTPMNGIIGFAKMLSVKNLTEEKREKYSDIIIKSTNRLLNVIDDLLDISILETGNFRLNYAHINLNIVIDNLHKQYQPGIAKNIKFTTEKSLSDEECIIYCDESILKKVYNQLLRNSIKFTTEGIIRFGYHYLDNQLEFFVEDSGIGIAKEHQEQIFERFRQADNNITRTFGGTGLGLAICKGILGLLNGSIRVDSELGKGSLFTFTLPCVPDKQSVHQPDEAMAGPLQAHKVNLLIVEDEDVNFIYLSELLSDGPYQIIRAENGAEAVEICKVQSIDLVLMDMKMPVMDGFEATKQIRLFNSNLPIIAQTAYTINDYHIKALQAGCNHYISKPFNREQLIAVIENNINM